MAKVERVEKKCNHPGCFGTVFSGRCNICNKLPWGGARRGAGMPKGKVTQKKLEQQEELQRLRQRIMLHVDELLEAQLKLALGEKVYLVQSKEYGKNGKIKRTYHKVIENPEIISKYLDGELDGDITCVIGTNPDNSTLGINSISNICVMQCTFRGAINIE